MGTDAMHDTLKITSTAEKKVEAKETEVKSQDGGKEIGTSMFKDQPPQTISIKSRSRESLSNSGLDIALGGDVAEALIKEA
jgi:hypothetical protein